MENKFDLVPVFNVVLLEAEVLIIFNHLVILNCKDMLNAFNIVSLTFLRYWFLILYSLSYFVLRCFQWFIDRWVIKFLGFIFSDRIWLSDRFNAVLCLIQFWHEPIVGEEKLVSIT